MNATNRTLSRAITVITASLVVLGLSIAPAAAVDDIDIVNTETVQVYTDATGAVKEKRLYEQLALTGDGEADFLNPAVVDGLRNLEGFGGYDRFGDKQVVKVQVDGRKNLRSVSDYDGDLPLEISVAYTLDGEPLEPEDAVGRSGSLEATFTVKNVSAVHKEISYDDGTGNTITEGAEVPVPMVGSLTTVLPPAFRDVTSQQANMAGDGRGNTKLSFTMTLIPPIGSDTVTFGYQATVDDAVVPRATMTALPVNPLKSPSFKSAGKSYKGGARTGADLADGALQIDSNLLKLRDGAGDLLAGLIKLRDGATQLSAGLSDEAAPGAGKAAAGASELSAGLNKLDKGAGKLARGTGKLSAGAGTATSGAQLLAQGQKDLLDGLRSLESGVQKLPASVSAELAEDAQYLALLAGMQKVVDGIGSPTDVTDPKTGQPATLFGGLNALRRGLEEEAKPQLEGALAKIPASRAGLQCAAAILGDLAGVGPDAPGTCFPGGARPPLTDEVSPVNIAVLTSLASNLSAGATQLTDLETGLSGLVSAIDGPFALAFNRLAAGLRNPAADPVCAIGAATPTPLDDCGVQQAVAFFKASIPTLVDGITTSVRANLLAGISAPAGGCRPDTQTLICGAGALAAGGTELSGGLDKLLAGALQLDDGAGRLADGAGDAAAGGSDLADGLGTLAGGLGDAATGSGQIAGGLTEAADGVPRLKDGAQRLSKEGSKELVKAGKDTAQEYGELYAVLKAGAQRAMDDDMVVGAPEGAMGLSAYTFELLGEKGESQRNLTRALIGLGLAVVAGGVLFARRRFASS